MVYRYLIYRTDSPYNDTVIRESAVSGTTGVNENELYTDFIIPVAQPFYLWRVSGDTVVIPNVETSVEAWLEYIATTPTAYDLATYGQLTGITADVNTKFVEVYEDIEYISGQTNLNFILLTGYSATTGLQQITEINAATTIESSFNGGIVINEIRPSGGTASAITINKADGVTPLITIDTISGLTGFGTTSPQNKIHVYGTYSESENLSSIQPNSITIDGVAVGDKNIIWADEGVPKWSGEIYRSEEGKFWYLYNVDGDLSPLTISNSGRIGINSPTNFIDYPPQSVSGTPYNTGLVIGGVYDKSYITVYEVRIYSTTGVTDIYQWRKSLDLGSSYFAWSTPTGVTTGMTMIDSGIEISFTQVTGFTIGDGWRFPAFPQLAPSTLTITGNRINRVLATLDYTVSAVTYIDLTAEANTSIVDIPSSMFETGTTTNAVYIGNYTKLNALFVNIIQAGEGITLIGEYWNGSAWIDISVSSGYFRDNTNNLTQTGGVTWNTNAMTDWSHSEPSELTSAGDYYWLRFRTASPSTVTALVGGVSRGSDMRFAVYASAMDYTPSFYVDALGRTIIGGGNITNKNLLQVNKNRNYQIYSGASSLVEFDNEDTDIPVMLKLRLANNDACGATLLMASARGTLDAPENPQYNDAIGCLTWGSQINNYGFINALISSNYIGNGSTYYGDLRFAVANGQSFSLVEKMRIGGNGVGFGITSPTAKIHLQSGATAANTAPLKFTPGILLATPEIGAVEFSNAKWYGTVSGTTRKTFAFLESPIFTGIPVIPTGTMLGNQNLYNFILNSGGTNIDHVDVAEFVAYTASTDTRLDGIENDIDYISGVTDTKLPTTVFAAYTGGTIPWVKVDKTGSNLADLATRNASDVTYTNTDWNSVNVADMLNKTGQYIEDTQISGRLTPENVLYQTDLNELYVDAGNGYIVYDGFHRLISWSGQTIDTSSYTLSGDVGTHYVYINTVGVIQISLTESDNIHNIRLGSFYWAVQIGSVKQDGGVISNVVARASDYFRRMGYFIYDNGGNIQLISANTTIIVSTPCKIQMGLMSVNLPQVATTLADISGLTMMVNYNSPDQGINADFYYINKSFYTGDAGIPTSYYNDPTQPSGLVLTAYTFNFTYGSNIVTSPDNLTGVLPTGDTFRIYDAFDGAAPYIYETLVTGHTWDGTGTTLTLAIPYFGAGGTGHTAVVGLATKNIPSGKWVKSLVLRTTNGQLAFYMPQTYYNTKEDAIAGVLPERISPFDTTTLNMAYIVYSAGSTTFGEEIYDVRPLPFSYQLGGQTGSGGGISNHGDLSGLANDDHLQYLRTDGTRNLTGIQHYQSHPTFTTNTDLIDKKYVDDGLALKVNTSTFNTFTGNTYTKSEINVYTGATSTRIGVIENNYVSGATNLGLGYNLYNGKSGRNLQFKSLSAGTTNVVLSSTSDRIIISVTGGSTGTVWGNITGSIINQTDLNSCLNARVTCTSFSTFTGTTLPTNYIGRTQFNTYTGATSILINTKAPITSPTFLTSACAPTPIADSNNTCIATTAFVTSCQVGTATPLMNGVAVVGTSLKYSRQDHVHPRDLTKVNVSGDTMTGALRINSNLTVTGFANISGATTTAGALKANSTLLVLGNTNISGDTRIAGSAYLGNITSGASQQNFVTIDSVSKKLASSGTKFHKYGTEYQLASDLTSTSTNSTSPVAKVTMTTTSLPAGTYRITVSWLWSRNNGSSSARFTVTIGGAAQGTRTPMNIEAPDGADVRPEVRIFYVALSGVNTIVFNHYGEGTAYSTTTSDATIELIRVI